MHLFSSMNPIILYDLTQVLLKKLAQLEEAWTQKDKFIHSSRMIIRFREEHISRLEKKLKAGQSLLSEGEAQAAIDQLNEEIKILRDQVKKATVFEQCLIKQNSLKTLKSRKLFHPNIYQ